MRAFVQERVWRLPARPLPWGGRPPPGSSTRAVSPPTTTGENAALIARLFEAYTEGRKDEALRSV
jgi:hypothetical protein